MKHTNLFTQLADKRAVYELMQRDYARDEARSFRAQWVLTIAIVVVGIVDVPAVRWFAGLVAVHAFYYALIMFIDNSNRNWTMHVFDWLEERNPHK